MSIDSVFEGIAKDIDDLKYDLLDDMFPKLVKQTPVNTGTARKGWAIAKSDTEIPFVPRKGYRIQDEDGLWKTVGGYTEMQGSNPVIKPIPAGIEAESNIVIGNKVDYLNLLNQGFSNQASPFYIELIVNRTIDKISPTKLGSLI